MVTVRTVVVTACACLKLARAVGESRETQSPSLLRSSRI
jgi:hypothetical protein